MTQKQAFGDLRVRSFPPGTADRWPQGHYAVERGPYDGYGDGRLIYLGPDRSDVERLIRAEGGDVALLIPAESAESDEAEESAREARVVRWAQRALADAGEVVARVGDGHVCALRVGRGIRLARQR